MMRSSRSGGNAHAALTPAGERHGTTAASRRPRETDADRGREPPSARRRALLRWAPARGRRARRSLLVYAFGLHDYLSLETLRRYQDEPRRLRRGATPALAAAGLSRRLCRGGRGLLSRRERSDHRRRLPVRRRRRHRARRDRGDARRDAHLPHRPHLARRPPRRAGRPARAAPARRASRRTGFSYLLFLRLVPLFPFWLVNLAAALFGMRLLPMSPRPPSASCRRPSSSPISARGSGRRSKRERAGVAAELFVALRAARRCWRSCRSLVRSWRRGRREGAGAPGRAASMNEVLTPDICVIGAGSAGLTVAAAAAALGVSVVLVEKDRMGGDCLNTGCVPSKALIAAARHAAGDPRRRRASASRPASREADFPAVMAHVRERDRRDRAERFRRALHRPRRDRAPRRGALHRPADGGGRRKRASAPAASSSPPARARPSRRSRISTPFPISPTRRSSI